LYCKEFLAGNRSLQDRSVDLARSRLVVLLPLGVAKEGDAVGLGPRLVFRMGLQPSGELPRLARREGGLGIRHVFGIDLRWSLGGGGDGGGRGDWGEGVGRAFEDLEEEGLGAEGKEF